MPDCKNLSSTAKLGFESSSVTPGWHATAICYIQNLCRSGPESLYDIRYIEKPKWYLFSIDQNNAVEGQFCLNPSCTERSHKPGGRRRIMEDPSLCTCHFRVAYFGWVTIKSHCRPGASRQSSITPSRPPIRAVTPVRQTCTVLNNAAGIICRLLSNHSSRLWDARDDIATCDLFTR